MALSYDRRVPEELIEVLAPGGWAHSLVEYGRAGQFACDLADLTPEHQQRWRTYEVQPNDDTGPHPMWWAMQMGQWPDGIGPFQRIIEEIKALSAIFELICGLPLFRSTEPPREWGWVLRPSTQEWGQFVHLTDKLLSDNLNKKALDAVKARDRNDDGTNAGTLTRLRFYLTDSTPCSDEFIDDVLKPLREVRKLRQKPAHELAVATTDASLTAQQRDLLSQIGEALRLMRQALQNHPAAREWSPPDHLDDGTRYVV